MKTLSATRMMNFSGWAGEGHANVIAKRLDSQYIIHNLQTHPHRTKTEIQSERICVSIYFLKLIKQFERFVLCSVRFFFIKCTWFKIINRSIRWPYLVTVGNTVHIGFGRSLLATWSWLRYFKTWLPYLKTYCLCFSLCSCSVFTSWIVRRGKSLWGRCCRPLWSGWGPRTPGTKMKHFHFHILIFFVIHSLVLDQLTIVHSNFRSTVRLTGSMKKGGNLALIY